MDLSIKWPFKWCLVGSSGSGKTNFSLQIIRHALRLFDQVPSKIVIVYKEFQNIYNQFNDYIPTHLYHEDEIDFEEITKQNDENLLIICDDLYYSKKINEVAEHFLDALASLESTVVGQWVSESVSEPQFRQGHNAAP